MSFSQRIIFLSILLCGLHFQVKAQKVLQATNDMMGGGGMGGFSGGRPAAKKGNDSLQLRDKNADSITIYYKLYNSNDIKKWILVSMIFLYTIPCLIHIIIWEI